MDCGPWLRSVSREFLYNFSSSNDEYRLLVTDMSSVYEERLIAQQIEERGEQLQYPFALDSERQRQAFGGMLASLLASETALFNVNIDSTVTVYATGEVPFHWRFNMSKLEPNGCIEVFAELATRLFGVIENLNGQMIGLDARISDSGAIIRGLENANSRQIPYTVPKSLEQVYRTALSGSVSASRPSDSVEIAQTYWPTKEIPLLEVLANEDTDSDATHESQNTSSSETVWAGSLRSSLQEH